MLCFHWRGTFPPTSASTLTWTRKSALFTTFQTDFSVMCLSRKCDRLWWYVILHASLFRNFPLGRVDICWVETRKEWCRSGTRSRFPPMVMRNFFNLCSGSGRTGTARTASGNLVQRLPAPKAVFQFLLRQKIWAKNFQVALAYPPKFRHGEHHSVTTLQFTSRSSYALNRKDFCDGRTFSTSKQQHRHERENEPLPKIPLL